MQCYNENDDRSANDDGDGDDGSAIDDGDDDDGSANDDGCSMNNRVDPSKGRSRGGGLAAPEPHYRDHHPQLTISTDHKN